MPLHFRLQDLPARFHKQVEEQLAPRFPQPTPKSSNPTSDTAPRKTAKSTPPRPRIPNPTIDTSNLVECDYTPSSVQKPPVKEFHGEPNKTEAEFNTKFLDGKGRYEAITLRLPGGNYCPDWFYFENGVPVFVEVKGGYRFGSESRAILAFREAAAMFPFWKFVWAQKQKGGKWIVKHVLNDPPIPLAPPPHNNISLHPDTVSNNVCEYVVEDSKGEGVANQPQPTPTRHISPSPSPSLPISNPSLTTP